MPPRQPNSFRRTHLPPARLRPGRSSLSTCLIILRGAVLGEKVGGRGATRENTLHGSATEEQRSHTAFYTETLRAAGLSALAGVGSVGIQHARVGDAPLASPARTAALAKSKIPRRSAPHNFQTGCTQAAGGSVADNVSAWLGPQHLLAVHEQLAGAGAERRLAILRSFVQDCALLRRGDQAAARLQLDREREKTEEEVVAHFQRWLKKQQVRDLACENHLSPKERERRMRASFGLAPQAPEAAESEGAEPNPVKPDQGESR